MTHPVFVLVIEKLWKEGSDFFKVENSIICHDGESIQGSHVTSHSGQVSVIAYQLTTVLTFIFVHLQDVRVTGA